MFAFERRIAVQTRVELNEVLEVDIGAEGSVGVAVHADHLGRHALVDFGHVVRLGQDDQAGVGVKIDEAGAYDLAPRVDRAGSFEVTDVAAQDAHRLAVDADGGFEADVARAVDDLAVGDQHIQHVNSDATIQRDEAGFARRNSRHQSRAVAG